MSTGLPRNPKDRHPVYMFGHVYRWVEVGGQLRLFRAGDLKKGRTA